jgi:hypothetical protein
MKVLSYCTGFFLLCLVACKKQAVDSPSEKDAVPPAPVQVEKVVPLSGAVQIFFAPPTDEDLLAVHAVYTGKDGKVRESKVSRFNNSINVVGFGDTSSYQVKLFAEDKGGNVSTPTEIAVRPGVPAITTVIKGLSVVPDFGGLNVQFDNKDGDNLAIVILANDTLGAFVPINTFYTNLKTGNFSTHGLPAVKTKIGIYVRDRWGNLSDTLMTNLVPLYETLLDRTKIKGVVLPSDAPLGYGGNIAALFDGDVTNNNGYYHTGDAAKMPQWFTFDMGVEAKLSRLVYFMRQGFYYTLHNPRNVEIWGSNNPASDGSFTNWTLLTTHEQIKPSGLPAGELSQADVDAATAGETITFPLDAPKVRYIRFKTTRNWSDGTYVNFNEIQLYGDPN